MIKTIRKKIIINSMPLLCVAMLYTSVHAQTSHVARRLHLKNNEQGEVTLSLLDVNRIFVDNDPITSIHGPEQRFMVKNDETGSVYLTPNGQTPFTLFFNTENKRHFSLLISPVSMPGQTVDVLMPKPVSHKHFQISQNQYEAKIESLVRGAMDGNIPDDFTCDTIKNAPIQKIFSGGFSAFLTLTCRGDQLSLSTYQIRNQSHHRQHVLPSYFYHAGIAAVALQHEWLKPGAITMVYEVSREKGDSDA